MDPVKRIHFAWPLTRKEQQDCRHFQRRRRDWVFDVIWERNSNVVITAHKQLLDAAGLTIGKDLVCARAIHCRRDPQYNCQFTRQSGGLGLSTKIFECCPTSCDSWTIKLRLLECHRLCWAVATTCGSHRTSKSSLR